MAVCGNVPRTGSVLVKWPRYWQPSVSGATVVTKTVAETAGGVSATLITRSSRWEGRSI